MSELEKLENELKKMEKMHLSLAKTYGSELCAGDMFRQEDKLKEKINKLKNG